jgi:hypothetical protein
VTVTDLAQDSLYEELDSYSQIDPREILETIAGFVQPTLGRLVEDLPIRPRHLSEALNGYFDQRLIAVEDINVSEKFITRSRKMVNRFRRTPPQTDNVNVLSEFARVIGEILSSRIYKPEETVLVDGVSAFVLDEQKQLMAQAPKLLLHKKVSLTAKGYGRT